MQYCSTKVLTDASTVQRKSTNRLTQFSKLQVTNAGLTDESRKINSKCILFTLLYIETIVYR